MIDKNDEKIEIKNETLIFRIVMIAIPSLIIALFGFSISAQLSELKDVMKSQAESISFLRQTQVEMVQAQVELAHRQMINSNNITNSRIELKEDEIKKIIQMIEMEKNSSAQKAEVQQNPVEDSSEKDDGELLAQFRLLMQSDNKRDKQIVIGLLYEMESDLAVRVAFALAIDREEDWDICQFAFKAGMDIDAITFSKLVLEYMNLHFSGSLSNQVESYLSDPLSGYPQLVEEIYSLMNRKSLKGQGAMINMVMYNYLQGDSASVLNGPIDEQRLQDSILDNWNRINIERIEDFDQIVE